MKAILLAGGKGTRLRPLTIHTPKPIVPIFDRPFLQFQLDLLKQVPEIDEVILSLNYQPRRIEEIFGDGGDTGLGLKYVVEPAPLGTAGAVRYAGESLRESVVVFNGDVLTQVDLGAVIAIAQINSYSWHSNSRGPQVYRVWASDGADPNFNPEPKGTVDPAKCGWKSIAIVDTRTDEEDGGQYGVSVTDLSGSLGKFRFLLFDLYPVEVADNSGNTFYSEIDVVAKK